MEQLLKLTGALYDPTRLTILAFLIQHGSCCVCELQASFGMVQSRLSRHLKILHDAGFLSSRREKQWIHYSINVHLSPEAQKLLEIVQHSSIVLPSRKPQCIGEKSMINVLILCTGNSCRSIIGEALINHHLSTQGVKAYSRGVAPSGTVNPNALQALNEAGISTEGLSSKTLDKLPIHDFDLVVTVCDHANETCPMLAGRAQKIHCGFQDPSGGEYSGYVNTLREIENILVPLVQEKLGLH